MAELYAEIAARSRTETRRLRIVHFERTDEMDLTHEVNTLLANLDPADVQRVGDVRWEGAAYRCTVVVWTGGPKRAAGAAETERLVPVGTVAEVANVSTHAVRVLEGRGRIASRPGPGGHARYRLADAVRLRNELRAEAGADGAGS